MRLLNMPARLCAPQRGLTLIELLVAMTIGALLLMTAAPNFSDYINNSRLREGGNLVLSEALLAQSEAVKRNNRVRLSVSGSTVQVLDVSTATPVVLRTRTLGGNVVVATAATAEFMGDGRLATWPATSTVTLSSTAVSCSDEMRCPSVVIEAGGAMRLCGNQLSCS